MSQNQKSKQGNYAVKTINRKPGAASVFAIKNANTSTPLNVIGPQVRKLREQKGWNQNQLITKLQLAGWDTSQGSLSRLENGERRVTDLELFVLSRVLGIKFEDLFPANLGGKIKALWPHYRVKLSRGQLPPLPKS